MQKRNATLFTFLFFFKRKRDLPFRKVLKPQFRMKLYHLKFTRKSRIPYAYLRRAKNDY